MKSHVVLWVLVLLVLSGCTLPASTRPAATETRSPQQQTGIALLTQTEQSSIGTEPVPTSTSSVTPRPTSTPTATSTPEFVIADIPANDPDHEIFERALELRWIRSCQPDSLSVCPESEVRRGFAFESMVWFMHGPYFTPRYPLGFYWDLPYASIFTDPDRLLYAAFAEQLWSEGMMRGSSADHPDSDYEKPLTKEQATVFLVRLLHLVGDGERMYEAPASPGCFSDVPGTRWSAKWVCEFATTIFYDPEVEGIEEFHPEDRVTIKQWVRWLNTAYENGFRPIPEINPMEDILHPPS